MSEIIESAGLPETPPEAPSARREVIKAARAVMRKSDATDEEYEDALEALIEASKD